MKRILLFILVSMMLINIVSCVNNGNVPSTTAPEKVQGWFIEVGEPTETVGVLEGQMCLDQDTFNLYQFLNSEWVLIGCIRGDAEVAPSLESKNGV